jgi:hypothetical protein
LSLPVVFVSRTSSTPVATWFWQTEGRSAERVFLGVRPSEFILLEFQSPSRIIFIGSHHSPPSGRLIGPSVLGGERSKERGVSAGGVQGALLDGGEITRGALKAPPLPCACACIKATTRRKPRWRGERDDGLGVRVNGAKSPTCTQRAHVHRCTGTPVGVRACACARRGHGHGAD